MARRQNIKVSKFYPNELYLFICEDEKSIRYYLEGIKPYLKPNIKLEARHSNNGNAAHLVHKCASEEYERINKNKEAYKRGFKVIACFDKDSNDIRDIKPTMNQKRKKVETIYNNPCYEFWLYLHAKNNAPIFSSANDCATKCMREINATFKKHFENIDNMKREKNIFEIVKKGFPQAVQNATTLNLEDYTQTYTNAHAILEKIVDLDKIENDRK